MPEENVTQIMLSPEQSLFIGKALMGDNILVDACIGSGKTTAIERLCCEWPKEQHVLYLTYNRLLKLDAKRKIRNAPNITVNNYHGFAWMALKQAGISCGTSDLIETFNRVEPTIDAYDLLVLDEYQDIDQELSDMLRYIKSVNPQMQIVAVGDMAQKIYAGCPCFYGGIPGRAHLSGLYAVLPPAAGARRHAWPHLGEVHCRRKF